MINLGLSFTSIYIFPTYSPIIPSDKSIRPPIPQSDITMVVQPCTVCPKSHTIRKYISITILTVNTSVPSDVIILIGFTLHDVIPSTANESIFFNGYFDSPANLSCLS